MSYNEDYDPVAAGLFLLCLYYDIREYKLKGVIRESQAQSLITPVL